MFESSYLAVLEGELQCRWCGDHKSDAVRSNDDCSTCGPTDWVVGIGHPLPFLLRMALWKVA